jgi:hypothetical protein
MNPPKSHTLRKLFSVAEQSQAMAKKTAMRPKCHIGGSRKEARKT